MKLSYIVIKGLWGGGIERYTIELGARLAKMGHEIVVYSMGQYGQLNGIYKGMKIKTVPSIKLKSLEKLSAAFFATVYNIFEKDVDIIHFHAFGPSMFCIIPKLLKRKIVVQGHGIEWQRSKWNIFGKSFLKLAEIPSVAFADKVTVVSKVQQNYLKVKYNINSIHIPPGVDKPLIYKPEIIKTKYNLSGNDYILFAARIVKEKGAHYLIEAYNRINTDLKLVIAGDSRYDQSYIKNLYNLAKRNNKIIFTGFITGKLLYELFSNCYLFVLPSELEGLPIVLLEAMSYGNCCLVSDIPENIEALDGHGFLFKNKNIESLRERLEDLINNPEKVYMIKGKAREYVLNKYSWDYIASEFENLYKGILNERN